MEQKLLRVRRWNIRLLTSVLDETQQDDITSPAAQYRAQLSIRAALNLAQQLKTVSYSDAEPKTEERKHTKEVLNISLQRYKEAAEFHSDFFICGENPYLRNPANGRGTAV